MKQLQQRDACRLDLKNSYNLQGGFFGVRMGFGKSQKTLDLTPGLRPRRLVVLHTQQAASSNCLGLVLSINKVFNRVFNTVFSRVDYQ